MKSGVIFIVIFSIILLFVTPTYTTTPSWSVSYCGTHWSSIPNDFDFPLKLEIESTVDKLPLGFSGINVDNAQEIAEVRGLNSSKGFLVVSVIERSAAEAAGFLGVTETKEIDGRQFALNGDVILSIDGKPITNVGDINKIWKEKSGGDEMIFSIDRNGRILELTLIVERGLYISGCAPENSVLTITNEEGRYFEINLNNNLWRDSDGTFLWWKNHHLQFFQNSGTFKIMLESENASIGKSITIKDDVVLSPHNEILTTIVNTQDSDTKSQLVESSIVKDEKSQVNKLQQKLDEYVNCGVFLISSNKDCIKQDFEKYRLGGIDEEIRLTSYAVNTDNTIENPKITDNIPYKLEKFSDVTLHNKLINSYNSVTTNDILNEIAWFYIMTDDYGGLEAASVFRPHEERYFHVNIDVVDAFPDGHNFDKQFMITTFIHENGHILSLKSDQGDGDTVSFSDVDFITKEKKNREKCEPQFYTYDAGCMYENSYLNQFYHEYWDNIYDEWSQKTNYGLDEEGIYDFYQKYKLYFVTDYAATNPEEDFAESFMMFVLKDKISPSSVAEQKSSFFYKFEELVDIRNFIRTAIATDEFCNDGTVWSDEGKCIVEKSEEGGGCLIATAAFGSEMAPQVQFLREIRDNTVMTTQSGTAFMNTFNQFYYSFSPQIADYERENPVFKEAVKVTLTPLLTSLTLLNYVDVDTEEEMLGYGIGIILLNIGMYFVAPAVIIVSLKKRLFI